MHVACLRPPIREKCGVFCWGGGVEATIRVYCLYVGVGANRMLSAGGDYNAMDPHLSCASLEGTVTRI